MPAHTIVEPPRQPAAPAASAADPYTRYFARVDQHLEGLPRSERLPFLRGQRTKFLADYELFCRDVDNGIERADENATDYVTIIAELGARVAREERQ